MAFFCRRDKPEIRNSESSCF